MLPESEDTFSMPSSHVVLDQVDVAFDDVHAVAGAGLLLPATLAERLGIEQATDQLVDRGEGPGAARPGRKLLTLVHALVAGRDCIDDVELLRCGSTQAVVGYRVMAPSTVGTWLRSFTFGHVRQLDRLTETILGRAWAAGAGPGDAPVTVDVDPPSARWLPQAGRRLRLHPPARLPPAAHHQRRHRRGAACPARKGAANTARGAGLLARRSPARLGGAGGTRRLARPVPRRRPGGGGRVLGQPPLQLGHLGLQPLVGGPQLQHDQLDGFQLGDPLRLGSDQRD
jgi:hypothetical protein